VELFALQIAAWRLPTAVSDAADIDWVEPCISNE
jgi:hypothetical protein